MRLVELDAALIGLIVGAVASGGVQATLAQWDRNRDARSAARLLYLHLHEAHKAVREIRKYRDWDRMITDWDTYGRAWDTHAEKLARVLDTGTFMAVASAFASLASLARSHAKSAEETVPPGTPRNFSVSDDQLTLYEFLVEAAGDMILNASRTRGEMRDIRRDVKANLAPKGTKRSP